MNKQNIFFLLFTICFFTATLCACNTTPKSASKQNSLSPSRNIITNENNDSFIIDDRIVNVYNPYKNKGNLTLKGQLHCHSTKSDARKGYTPEKVVDMYYDAGYDFITISDHNTITKEPENNKLIWIGCSYEDTRNKPGWQHCNVINTEHTLGKIKSMYQSKNSIADLIFYTSNSPNTMVMYNHPDDPVVCSTDEFVRAIPKGLSFVEVYNSCDRKLFGEVPTKDDLPENCSTYGDAYIVLSDGKLYANTSENADKPEWKVKDKILADDNRAFGILLDTGHKVFGVASDDFHMSSCFDKGWIVVFSDKRDKDSILEQLTRGCFYASSGVEITDVSISDGKYKIETSSETATTVFYGKGNEVLKTATGKQAEYQIKGNESYVRAVITEATWKKAWTQPVFID